MRFLWERLQLTGRADCSDAGMACFLLTGDEESEIEKVRRVLVDHVAPTPTQPRKYVRLEAENFLVLENYEVEDRNAQAARQKVGLIAFPELAVTGGLLPDGMGGVAEQTVARVCAAARVHVNLSREPINDGAAALRWRQIGTTLSTFMAFTVMANHAGPGAGHNAIWDDLGASEETGAEVRGLPRPDPGPVRVFAAFAANRLAEWGTQPGIIAATRHIAGGNPHYPSRTAAFHPAMDAWYVPGAELIRGSYDPGR